MNDRPLTIEQSAAGRALLGWSQKDLAEKAHLGESTVRNFEKGRGAQTYNNVLAMRIAMEAGGVVFIDAGDGMGVGARLREDPSRSVALES
jgi:transcriptional regulator with XRE-family HTH domain